MMNTRNIENILTLLAALIVLIGVSSAAGSALAAEPANRAAVVVTERAATDEARRKMEAQKHWILRYKESAVMNNRCAWRRCLDSQLGPAVA